MASALLSIFFLIASVRITSKDASSPETACGKKTWPIPIERLASTTQLPIMSPITISYCFLRSAVRSTASSGRDVPIATKKKLMMYSGMLRIAESTMTD